MSSETQPWPKILDSIRTALASLQAAAGAGDSRVDLTWRFMYGLFELGLASARDPAVRQSGEVAAFLQETAPQLFRAINDVKAFIRVTEYGLQDTWYSDEWRWTSIRRSSLEFLRDLYRGTSFGEYLEEFDLKDLDELLRQRGEGEGFLSDDQIPAGMPKSHWWWWYPNEPPEK